MIRKKRNSESKEDVFELSDELNDIEDSQSIEAIREQEEKEVEYVADEALYTPEELESIFDKSPPPVEESPEAGDGAEVNQEAIFSSDKEMDQALDATAARKESQGSDDGVGGQEDIVRTAKLAKQTQEIQRTPYEIQVSDFFDVITPAEKSVCNEQEASVSRLELLGEAMDEQPCRTELLPVSEVYEAFEFSVEPEPPVQEQPVPLDESAYKKAAFKAKALFSKNKAHVDEYLGRTLPERELALEFSFASLKSKKDIESIASTRSIRLLFSSKGKSLTTILKKADEDLCNIARCNLSKSHKLSLLDAYTPPLFEKIQQLISQFEKRPSVHEDTKRLELAEHGVHAIKHAITGYKQLYTELYESSNLIYGPQRGTANRIVCRLIDLLCLEQLLLCALHQPIPTVSVKAVNKLFHVLCCYEPQLIEEEYTSQSWEGLASIKDLYLVYQVMLSFQLNSISGIQHKLLKQYFVKHLGLLRITERKSVGDADEMLWVLSQDHSEAPVLDMPKSEANAAVSGCPSLLIQPNVIFNRIIRDYTQCLAILGEGKRHSCPVLGSVDALQALNLMSVLNWSVCLLLSQSKPQSLSLYDPVKLLAYSDFKDCVAYFAYLYNSQNKDKESREEQDSEKAPVIKKPKASGSQWWSAMEDEESIYLQTDEKKSSIALDVGILMLLVRSNQEQEEVLLVRISRIERIQSGKLSLVAQKLVAKAVAVEVKALSDDAKRVPALVGLQDDKAYLLTTHQTNFHNQQKLGIRFPDKSVVVASVEGLASVSHNLQVLKLA